MDRKTPTVAELVRQAVETCDPAGHDEALSILEEQLEDDDTPITAVQNLEERLAIAVAAAIVLYLAAHHGHASYDGDPEELIELAIRAQWHGHPPSAVSDWLALR
jgi:hypothetical protein